MKLKTALLALPFLSVVAAPSQAAVKWRTLPAAMSEAKRTGKPIFIDFYATWCKPCHILEKAYATPAMRAEVSRYIMVKIDVEKDQAAASKYQVTSMPTMVFLDSKGKMVQQKVGFSVPPSAKTEKDFVKYAAKDVNAAMKWVRKNKL